jgi:hypothetical protein
MLTCQALLDHFPEHLSSEISDGIVADISYILATAFLSTRPWLYETMLDFASELRQLEHCHASDSPGKGMALLSSLGNFANGAMITAAVGASTLVSLFSVPSERMLKSGVAGRQTLAVLYPYVDQGCSLRHGDG